jgi:hypothetical protein
MYMSERCYIFDFLLPKGVDGLSLSLWRHNSVSPDGPTPLYWNPPSTLMVCVCCQ